MRTAPMFLSALAMTGVMSAAHASELRPLEGFSVKLANVTGSAYYTIEKSGYQVVATLVLLCHKLTGRGIVGSAIIRRACDEPSYPIRDA